MVLIWGYSWIVMKIALRHAHPFDFAAWRVGMGAVLLFLLVKLMGKPLTLPGYRMAVILGILQVALFVALSHFALLEAGPGKTSVLIFTMPFWMVVFAHFILQERMRAGQWMAVALAFVGLTLIVAPWNLTSLLGSVLAVAGGSVWAISAVLSKRWPTRADPLTFTAWQLLVGFFVLLVLAFVTSNEPIHWNAEFIGALAFSTIAATAIGWWLWTYILSNTPAGIAGLNSLGIPVVAVLASWIQLDERPPPPEMVGMVLIGCALALLAVSGLRNGRPAPAAPGESPRS